MKALEDLFDAVSKAEADGTQVDRIDLGSFFWSIMRSQMTEEREQLLEEQKQREAEILRAVPTWESMREPLFEWPEHIPEGALLFGIPVRERSDLAEGFRLWSAKRR